MNKRTIINIILFVSVMLIFSFAVSAQTIDSCQELSVAGNYELNKSVNTTGDCLTITADDVTLDCAGFSITGSNSNTGVYVGADRAVIKNCNISSFEDGISIFEGNDITVENNTIYDCSSYGIMGFGSEGSVEIKENEIFLCSDGIFLVGEYDGDVIEHNTIYDIDNQAIDVQNIINANINYNTMYNIGGYGIFAYNTNTSDFVGNYINNTGDDGIYSGDSENTTIEDNNITEAGNVGIYGETSEDWIIIRNNILSNSYKGIVLNEDYDGDIIEYNTVYGMTGEGISLYDLINAKIRYNNIYNNTNDDGIYMSDVHNSTISYNNFTFNKIGIAVSQSNNNTFEDNDVLNNTDEGIYVSYSDENTFKNNDVINNSDNGIYIYYSDENTISGGEIGNNNQGGTWTQGGIQIRESSSNSVSGAYMHNNKFNAIVLWSGEGDTDYNVIDSNNIDENCGGNAGIMVGSSVDHTVIKNNNVTNGTGYGVFVSGSTNNLTIKNNFIKANSDDAIYVSGGSSHTITGNTIIDVNDENMIRLNGVSDSTVSNNNIDGNGCLVCYGLYVGGGGSNTISNNDIRETCDGIYLSGGTTNNNVIDNTLTENNIDGCFSGIHIDGAGSTGNNLTNNDMADNFRWGLNADDSDVKWLITKTTTLTNNNASIYGKILFEGGSIVLDNSYIFLNGTKIDLTDSTMSSLDGEVIDLTENTTSDVGINDTNLTFYSESNGSLQIIVGGASAAAGNAGYNLLKAVDIVINKTLSGNEWTYIQIFYTDAELAAANIEESTLKMWFYNTTASAWQQEPNSGVDTENNFIWANVTHFSLFGGFGTAPSSPSSPSSGGGGSSCRNVWSCSDWSDCSSAGTQTRTCTDIRACSRERNKPVEEQDCVYVAPVVEEEAEDTSDEEEEDDTETASENQDLQAVTEEVISDTSGSEEQLGVGKSVGFLDMTKMSTLSTGIFIVLAVIVVGMFLFSNYYGGLPHHSDMQRASNFHKRAENAHRKGKTEKAYKLYKRANQLRKP